MSNADIAALESPSTDRRAAIQRLLFVADAAVADVDELPPAVRTVIDAAADVYRGHAHAPRTTRLAGR